MAARTGQGGMTLVEAVVAVVVLGLASAGVMLAISTTLRHSSDPLIYRQALALAESQLEQALTDFSQLVPPPGFEDYQIILQPSFPGHLGGQTGTWIRVRVSHSALAEDLVLSTWIP